MQADSLPAVLARIRLAWSTRRCCGLAGSAIGIRVERIIVLVDEGTLPADRALCMALEAEALALGFAPLPRGREIRASL